MAIQLLPQERSIPRIVDAIIQLVMGRMNSVGEFTITLNAASTVVSFENCSTDSRIFIMPQTAAAAAALGTTYIDPAEIAQGSFTVRHANSATADRTFSFLCIGG